MTDPATALVFFGLALLIFCACGALAERYLFRSDEEER